jgi:membrane protease YdiL (CAAX protease family)
MESLLLILVGVVACMLVGGVVNAWVPVGELDWVRFLVATVTFHAAALLVVHAVMREVGLGWRLAFGLGRGRLWRVLGLGVMAGLMVLPLAWLASWLTAETMRLFFVEPAPQEVVATLQETQAWWAYGVMGLMAVTVAPLAEEVLFRGLLYPFLKERLRLEFAVALSALVFGMIHMNLMSLPSLVFLAVVLIWLYEVTGNLLAPVAAHAVFNLANLLLLLTL